MSPWERAEAEADRVREARRAAPPVSPALVHEGMAVLSRRGEVGQVVRVAREYAVVRVGARRLRRWSLASIVEAKAA